MSLPQPFVDLVLSEEFASLRTAGSDAGIVAALNALTLRGLVPIVEVARHCSRGITGTVQAVSTIAIGDDIASGVPMTVQIKAALNTVLNLVQTDFRLEYCDTDDAAFGSVCDLLVSLGIMTEADKTTLIALGDDRVSRAENTLGRACTVADISLAIRGV